MVALNGKKQDGGTAVKRVELSAEQIGYLRGFNDARRFILNRIPLTMNTTLSVKLFREIIDEVIPEEKDNNVGFLNDFSPKNNSSI